MQTQPPEDWLSRAEMRRAEATRLLAAGRPRDALKLLNSAIQLAPGHPPLFATRAEVFEQLGMMRQAEGDRRQAQELSARFGEAASATEEEFEAEALPEEATEEEEAAPIEEEAAPAGEDTEAELLPEEAPAEIEAAPVEAEATPIEEEAAAPIEPEQPIEEGAAAEPAPAPAAPFRPPAPPAKTTPFRRGPAMARPARSPAAVIGGLLASLVVIAIAGSAVVLAVLSLFDQEDVVPGISDDDNTSAAVSPTPAASPGAPIANVEGSPFGLSEIQTGWTSRGLNAEAGDDVTGFSGFAVEPAPLTLSRGGDSVDVAVMVYRDAASMRQDWNLPAGSRPSPAAGRSLPSHSSIWWNQNSVVVVLSGDAALAGDAFDAYIDLAP